MSVDVIDLVDLAHQENGARTFSTRRGFTPGCIIISRDRKMKCIVTMPIKLFT
jgi:hypothetical protein